MLEQKREKILLAVVAGLLTVLVLDRLALRPLYHYVSGADERIETTRKQLQQAERMQQRADGVREKLQRVEQRLRGGGEQQQNEFRQHLESLAASEAEVRSSKRVLQTPLAGQPDLFRLRYDLELAGRQSQLLRVLAKLDRQPEPLKVDNVEIERTSGDDPVLIMRITVSALASKKVTDPAPLQEPEPLAASRVPQKNIFFPLDEVPAASDTPANRPASAEGFVLRGTVVGRDRKAALMELPDGRPRWIRPGQSVAGLAVTDVLADAMLVNCRGEEVRLAVGEPCARAWTRQRAISGPFELVGVGTTGADNFAVVLGEGDSEPRRVHAGDRVGDVTVVGINADGVVLDAGGERDTLPVGALYSQPVQ
ncbi:MAG: hypothetical protein ACOC93_00565 [Planctomycetota bacterium]